MTNDDDQDAQDAPPAVPEWEPGETAVRIASGHAGLVHFRSLTTGELARTVQVVMDAGRVKRRGDRALYWDPESDVAVIVNPLDRDGGTVFPSDVTYFAEWGDPEEGTS